LLPLVTSTLHWGHFNDRGVLPTRITFDHRVLDGAFVARGLAELEKVLQTTVLEELLQARPLKRLAA
jgi:pyruvate/2-oxoglutarate dehydrogenase complex dihydrolipoamide acyltransferase (E2) component